MQTTLSLSAKADTKTGKREIYIRFSGGRDVRLRGRSGVFIDPAYWNEKEGKIKKATHWPTLSNPTTATSPTASAKPFTMK